MIATQHLQLVWLNRLHALLRELQLCHVLDHLVIDSHQNVIDVLDPFLLDDNLKSIFTCAVVQVLGKIVNKLVDPLFIHNVIVVSPSPTPYHPIISNIPTLLMSSSHWIPYFPIYLSYLLISLSC